MRDFRDAKAMAQTLREAFKAKSVPLTHSESLELVAKTFGLPDWNFLAAKIQASQQIAVQPAPTIAPSSISAGSFVPVIPMRDIVVFPQMVVPIFVGREKTRRAIERAAATDGRIAVLTQRRAADDDPALYQRWAKIDLSALPQGPQARFRLPSVEEPGGLADSIAPLLPIGIERKQQLLATGDVVARLEAILELMKAAETAA